jgi:hypothetical protein
VRASASVRSPRLVSRAQVTTVSETRGAFAAVVGQHRPFDFAKSIGRDKHLARRLARDAFRRGTEQPSRELFVDPAMTDHHQIGGARALANLVGDDAHVEHGLDREIFAARGGGKFVEHATASGGQHLAHLGREIQIWFQPERT